MTTTQAGDDTQTTFYATIPPIEHIRDITDPGHYVHVPADWLIALSDVRGSTQAIQQGRYRDVNSVAAASITAMLNAVERRDIPFVFGGDGATMLVPPDCRESAAAALLATRELAATCFQLDLRVAIVPVRVVLEAGYRLQVAKLWISDKFQQAIFDGGGLSYAESLMKHPEYGPRYAVPEVMMPQADFHGFECRWNQIRSTHGETVSLIILAVGDDSAVRSATYRDVLQAVEDIYGDRDTRHPVAMRNMRLAFNPARLKTESRVRHRTNSLWQRLKMLRGSLFAALAMRLGVGEWPQYKRYFVEATDHEKFDDTLRMIISGRADQRERLDAFLAEQYRAGRLVYGIHVSDFVLVTCIVFDYFGRQVHFVDGSHGGYALAARQMKAQLAGIR